LGGGHIKTLRERVQHAVVTAACDVDAATAGRVAEEAGATAYTDYDAMLAAADVDAVIVATPHRFHPDQVIAAFEAGKHVLCEKPVAVEVRDADRMNAAYEKVADRLVYSVMFQYRTRCTFRKVHELVAGGRLGPLRRLLWVCTDWYRTQAYYDSGTWRGTWDGEGGGILLNQMPHNLDILTWLTGLPARVLAKVHLGKDHDIEVEDEINAILTYPDGATGVLTATTGDWPGTDLMEIACDRGKVRLENGALTGLQLSDSISRVTRATDQKWGKPATAEPLDLQVPAGGGGHADILQNWVDVIRGEQDTLIAPGVEGAAGLELGNAILYSGLTGSEVELPLDRDAYHDLLEGLIARSTQ
jgi:predicted dehydrogenase